MIKQKSVMEVEIGGKVFQLYCDNDSPLGSLHDALMMMKGWTVERMQAAQMEEEAISAKMKAIDDEIEREKENV